MLGAKAEARTRNIRHRGVPNIISALALPSSLTLYLRRASEDIYALGPYSTCSWSINRLTPRTHKHNFEARAKARG